MIDRDKDTIDTYGSLGQYLPHMQGQMESELINMLYKSYTTLDQLVTDLRSYEDYYLCERIVEGRAKETLSQDPMTQTSIRFGVREGAENEKEINERIERILNRLDMEKILADQISPGIFWGTSNMRRVYKENEGLIDLIDDVPPGRIITLHRKHLPSVTLEFKASQVLIKNPYDYWSINFNQSKAVFPVSSSLVQLPYHIRFAKPLFSTLLPQLRDLVTYEIIDVVKETTDLTRQNMVGVSVPDGLDIPNRKSYKKFYEDEVNKQSLTPHKSKLGPKEIESSIRSIGKFNVILQDGSKGDFRPIDLRTGTGITMSKIEDKRRIICSSANYPYDMLFEATDNTAGSRIRQYASLQKAVQADQEAISLAWRQLLAHDCELVGIGIANWNDLTVEFVNAVDAVQLQTLESVDVKIGIVRSVMDLMESLSDSQVFGSRFREENAIAFVDTILSSMRGANDILSLDGPVREDPKDPLEDEAESEENLRALVQKEIEKALTTKAPEETPEPEKPEPEKPEPKEKDDEPDGKDTDKPDSGDEKSGAEDSDDDDKSTKKDGSKDKKAKADKSKGSKAKKVKEK